jgi:hypothetical protein
MKPPPKLPTSLHWLGDRTEARDTRHAQDSKGCVLYFDTPMECVSFMKWLNSQHASNAE